MKYQAPPDVTALFIAGEEIQPDANGGFEGGDDLIVALQAHGCVALLADAPAPDAAKTPARAARARSEKAA